MNKRLPGGDRALAALVAFGACVLATPAANAAGYLTARYGSDHGSPVAANPFAIYFNPGALAFSPAGTQLTGDLTGVYRAASYERTTASLSPSTDSIADDPNYSRANTGTAKVANVLALPFAGVASDLGVKNLKVGYAIYVPFGGQASWRDNKVWAGNTYAPGAVDGPQRWANISGSIAALFNTVAGAYRFERARLSVGVNASLVYSSVKTVRARNVDGSDDVRGLNGALKEGRSYLDVSGFTYAFGIGLLWDAVEDGSLKLGASYTTQPGFGEIRMKGSLINQTGSDRSEATAADADLLQAWPDLLRVGLAYRPAAKTEIRIDGEYVRWSVFKHQCVVQRGASCELHEDANRLQGQGAGDVILNLPRDWSDTIGIRFGGAYFPNDLLEIFGSVAVATGAVPRETIDASTIDADQVFITFGGKYAFTPKLGVAASYTQIIYGVVDTEGKSQLSSYASTSRAPRADGIYKQYVSLLNVNATYTF